MDEGLAKGGRDIDWVAQSKASKKFSRIVEHHEKRTDVLCLCKALVELFVQVC